MSGTAGALLVALGAAVGAPLRFVTSTWLDARDPGGVHWGTMTVNVAGSFLLGLFTALGLGEHPLALLGTGFCGGLTTYSAFAVQSVAQGRRRGSAYAVGTVVLALGACALGFVLG